MLARLCNIPRMGEVLRFAQDDLVLDSHAREQDFEI